MSRRKPKLSALRRRELAQDKRQRAPRGFQGIGPRVCIENRARLEREQERQSMLVAYAVALAQKRGVLGAGLRDLNDVSAMLFEAGLPSGTARVAFRHFEYVQTRFGEERRPHGEPFATVELRNLDWVPAEPVEEIVGDDVPLVPRKSPGQLAYETDVSRCPTYQDGAARRAWATLGEPERDSWERNPTPRSYAINGGRQ